MTTKIIRTIEHTCDRCGDLERISYPAKGQHDPAPPSKGLLLHVAADERMSELGPFLVDALDGRLVPDEHAGREARIRLCVACRGLFARFMQKEIP
jgi:hypothetical protein